MNIFVLDDDPRLAAQYHCDKHVVKMILEVAQMMCTAHRELDGVSHLPNNFQVYPQLPDVELYKATHKNHPCSIWVRENTSNYLWTFHHLHALATEYAVRYGRAHATWQKLWWVLGNTPKNIRSGRPMTPFAQAMPDQYRNKDAVKAYRDYYLGEKREIAKWKNGAPTWWTEHDI